MNNTIEVSCRDVSVDTSAAVKDLADRVLKGLDRSGKEVSIVFCNDEMILTLNRDYRGKDEPTDVLSFCQTEGDEDFPETEEGVLGDIVVSLPAARRNAEQFKVEVNEEVKRLIIHGLLHLCGWDHETNRSDEEMLLLQEEILKNYSEVEIFN